MSEATEYQNKIDTYSSNNESRDDDKDIKSGKYCHTYTTVIEKVKDKR